MPFLEAMPVTASSRRIAEIRRLGQHLGQPGLPRFDSAPTVRPFLNDQSAAQRYSAFDKCHADPDGARIRIRRILDQVLPAQFLKKRFPRNGLVAWIVAAQYGERWFQASVPRLAAREFLS